MKNAPDCTASSTPCASCPWRRQNQTPSAVRTSPRDWRGTAWFNPSNLRRHWDHIRTGGMMPCHATDQRAHLYGGKRAKTGVEQRLCVGLVVMVQREVFRFLTAHGNVDRYTALGGDRFTLSGLAQWAARLNYPGATFEMVSLDDGVRKFTLPIVDRTVLHPDVTLPWPDVVQTPAAPARRTRTRA